uniref:Uncharacterized protein n=1 Tax=Prymnesium polylepis TaxID=72548 RepID=A0A7S4I4E5_9EUKA
MRSGVPTVVTPVMADQPGYAKMVHALGAGVGTAQLGKLTAKSLGAALQTCLTSEPIQAKARELSAGLRAEDGALTAVRHITTFLADEVRTGVWRDAFDAKIRRRKPPCGGWCPCACCSCLCTCCAVCCTPHPFGPPVPR